jgi:hypothetical protein
MLQVRLNNRLSHLSGHLLLNMGNIIPLWKLHYIFKMLAQNPRLAWFYSTSWLMASSTCLTWLKIWRPINAKIFYRSGVFSKVTMGVMNISKTCKVIEVSIISWPIPIWCGVRSKLIDKNSEYLTIMFNIVNEGSTSSTCSLAVLSLSHRFISNNGNLNKYGKMSEHVRVWF